LPILSDSVDPVIQQALRERISQIFAPNASLDPYSARVKSAGTQIWRKTAKKSAGYFFASTALFFSAALSAPLLAPSSEGLALLAFTALGALGIGVAAKGFKNVNSQLTRYANAGLLREATNLVTLSSTEQLYCSAVAALIDCDSLLTEQSQTEILDRLNTLLATARKLEEQLHRFGGSPTSSAIERLTKELETLAARRDALNNPASRELMDQSIELCTQRLQDARALLPAMEQAGAQLELIHQTLASTEESLKRVHAANASVVEADISSIRGVIDQTYTHAKAVEDAVAELNASAS
jgi:hypothetical protein